jgi:mannitol/fructose-specific phosphotransferase system IIA component (Ntr-type)
MTARSKDEVINGLTELLASSPQILDIARVRAAIFKREGDTSTAIGHGIAVPHGKTDAVSGTVAAFGVTREPVDFQSLDGTPVRLVFLFVSKDTLVGQHVKLLSRIARMLGSEQFRARLLGARTPREIVEAFRSEETHLAEA